MGFLGFEPHANILYRNWSLRKVFILFFLITILFLFFILFYSFIFIIFFLKTHIKPACNRNSEERELMSVTVKSHAIYKKSRYLNPHLHITKTLCPALFTEQNPKSVWKKHRLGVQARDLIGWKPYFGVLLHRLGVQTRDVIGLQDIFCLYEWTNEIRVKQNHILSFHMY